MSHKILIACESKTIVRIFSRILESYGLSVISSSCLSESYASITQDRPDLILCGLHFKDGEGLDLCRKLKMDEQQLTTPIIMLSDKDDHEILKQSLNAGASDLIRTDCSESFLAHKVVAELQHFTAVEEKTHYEPGKFTVLIAEDSRAQRLMYKEILSNVGLNVVEAVDGLDAWLTIPKLKHEIDLFILDINMPKLEGDKLCRLIRNNSEYSEIPIVVVSATKDTKVLNQLLGIGVEDYLHKPFSHKELLARVNSHLRNRILKLEQKTLYEQQAQLQEELKHTNASLEILVKQRTKELYEANVSTIMKLAIVCDYKDNDCTSHINRIRLYTELVAKTLGINSDSATEMGLAAMMHDVGKCSIPDAVLTKPGALSEDEWVIMRAHTTKGAEIFGSDPFFKTAKDIALSHHEGYDGKGYPHGLKGMSIPLSARICTVVDIFDALLSKRCYKTAWTMDDALVELNKLAGNKLDPELVTLFIALLNEGQLQVIWDEYPY